MIKKIIFILLLLILGYRLYECRGDSFIKNIVINSETDFYSIKASYPEDPFDKEGIMGQMVKYLVDLKKEEWRDGGEIYNKEKELSEKFPERSKVKYELNVVYATSSSQKFDTRSYIFNVYQFTGGAHGNTAIATYNFNKKGLIKIEDIVDFGSGNYIKLAKILRTKLQEKLGGNSDLRMINEGLGLTYLKSDNTIDKEKCNCEGFYFPSNIQHFTIADEGVKFIFSQYQVAPYVVGMPQILVNWDELQPFLHKNNRFTPLEIPRL